MMRQLTNWFRRGELEGGLDRELRYHLDRRVSDLEKVGLTIDDARRQALLELGGVAQIQEEVRDVWLTRWLRDFAYDLRYSARSFLRTPSFTITAVVSMMLGIGATTAIYSLVDQVLLHALPVREPARLVLVDATQGEQVADGFGGWNLMSYPICRDLDAQKQFFEGVFCRALTDVNLSTGGDYHPAMAEIVSGNYFSLLGVRPALGRVLIQQDDGVANANPVVVISYDFWKTQLGGAADVLGRKLIVNMHSFVVVGVAASTFRGIDVGEVPSVWVPASMSDKVIPGYTDLRHSSTRWMQVLGRLSEGVTLKQARVGLQPWFKAMLQKNMNEAGFPKITPEQMQEYLHSSLLLTAAPQGHSDLRRILVQPLWVLFAATMVLLGLACLNVSGLFLARGSARDREIGTRLALGASRGRLGRQFLADSLLIGLTGGFLGAALAPLVVRALVAFLPKNTAANALHAGVDTRLLLFAFGVSVTAGVLSGLAPAWQSGRRSLVSSLQQRDGTAFGGVRLRKVIVTAQIALTLTLVVGATLFVRTLDALMTKGPGFVTSSMVSFTLAASRNGYSKTDGSRLIRRLDEAIRNSPITQVSAVAGYPLLTGGSWNNPITIQADRRITTDRVVNLNIVTPGFFRTMGIRILAGRNFDERDARPSGENGFRSAIVNESFVKRFLGGRNPLGLRIGVGSGPDVKMGIEIVGVMSDFSYRGLRDESEQAFVPFLEAGSGDATFYVRVRGTPESAFQTLRTIVHNADPALPVMDLRTLDEQVSRSLNTEHMLATLSGGFSLLALVLSVVGLYGVMSFVVTRRTREIGIRLALGADRWSAIWMVLRDALLMILAGIGIGLPVVWFLGKLIVSQLYDVKPFDPTVITMATLVLGTAGLSAALVPAHRASGVNPTESLRAE
jgi:predicted permease